MKSSIHIILFFLLGLVASFAIPRPGPRSSAQYIVADFSGKEVCYLTWMYQRCNPEALLTE